jgi:hypothetical protein
MKRNDLRNWIYRAALAGLIAMPGSLAALGAGPAQTVHQSPPPTARQPYQVTDLKSAVDQTAVIVEGLVSDIQYEYSDEDGPWTRVILSDVQAHFGEAELRVEIRHFGGPLPNGKVLVVSDLPEFVQGKRYIVFLRNTAWNVSPVVGDLALRVETLDGAEVLVSADGQALTGVSAEGLTLGPTLFESPDLNGAQPKALGQGLPSRGATLLDRAAFLDALGSTLTAKGLTVGGTFYDRPAGEFKWRAQRVAPATGSK